MCRNRLVILRTRRVKGAFDPRGHLSHVAQMEWLAVFKPLPNLHLVVANYTVQIGYHRCVEMLEYLQ